MLAALVALASLPHVHAQNRLPGWEVAPLTLSHAVHFARPFWSKMPGLPAQHNSNQDA